jgi:hypothetical protein
MRLLKTSLLALMTAGMVFDPVMFVKPAFAQPAFFFNTHKTRLPHASCMQDARRTVYAVGLAIKTDLDFAIGGDKGTASGTIICTFIPGGGPCPGQAGAVVTIIATSLPGPDAKALFDQMVSTFGNGVLIDCG